MRWMRAALVAITLGFTLGCADLLDQGGVTPTTAPTPASENPEQRAARIADGIAKDPDQAGVLLKAEGMTEADFEKLMYAIAQDPQRSKTFQAARKK